MQRSVDGEEETVPFWQRKRDGSERGIVEIVEAIVPEGHCVILAEVGTEPFQRVEIHLSILEPHVFARYCSSS
jgi:hypothetical protein